MRNNDWQLLTSTGEGIENCRSFFNFPGENARSMNYFLFVLLTVSLLIPLCACDKTSHTQEEKMQGASQPAPVADKKPFDFRKTNWGMTKDELRQAESVKPGIEKEEALGYKVEVAGMDAILAYEFSDGRLIRGIYGLSQQHTNKNDYISDYKEMQDKLTTLYKKPVEDKIIWKNSHYKDDTENWGIAISIGHLLYRTKWETPTTVITHILSGDNYVIQHIVGYEDKAQEHNLPSKKESEGL